MARLDKMLDYGQTMDKMAKDELRDRLEETCLLWLLNHNNILTYTACNDGLCSNSVI